MFTALLLPFLLTGPSLGAGQPPVQDDDPAVQLWISNDRRFLTGDRAKVQVRSREDGYLLVLHADPDGHLRVLFPLDPADDAFVRGGRKYEVRGRGGRESFTVDVSTGRGTVYAAVSREPFRFDQFVAGDHWDYRALAPDRLPREPESELNDLVRRMAPGSFDYDILTYNVIERVVYANDYSYSTPYSGSVFYGGCGGYYGCGRPYYGSPYSLSVGLFFGRPYRRFYYDPFFAGYNSFYDPFFYDPFYYRSTYFYPVGPFYPRYYGYYNQPRSRGFDRPYTPYRFRSVNGTPAGYRDRRYDLGRSVNTVYMPPNTRVRQPVNANPIRRVADRTPPGQPPGVEARREVRRSAVSEAPRDKRRSAVTEAPRNDRRAEPILERRPIEARRARPADVPRSAMPDDRGRRDLPVEVRPLSREENRSTRNEAQPSRGDERPRVERAPVTLQRDPVPEARPSRRNDEPRDALPPSNRGVDRGNDRGGDRGSDRGSYSPPPDRGGDRGGPPPSRSSDDGGRMSGGRRR